MDNYREAKDICRQLSEAGYPTKLAGGCVRDHLLGRTPADYDLATTAHPETVMSFFKERGFRIIPVGLEHGTVCLVTRTQHLEITTLRHDLACDGRHAQVTYSDDFREDARRRDFTINALYEDCDGQIHDHVGGLADMQAHHLRFVGDPGARIEEDYLRILRYFRFLGRLGWEAHADQLAAIAGRCHGLNQLSAERIQKEMGLTLTTAHVEVALRHLVGSGALETLFPWYRSECTDVLASTLKDLREAPGDMVWHAFFYLGGGRMTVTEAHLEPLRFSRREKRAILGIGRLLDLLDRPEAAASYLFRLARGGAPELAPLKHYLNVLTPGITLPALLPPLLDGLMTLPDVDIPREALHKHPPQHRGELVDLAKIYWYLGACRDKTDVTEILKHPAGYREKLKLNKVSLEQST